MAFSMPTSGYQRQKNAAFAKVLEDALELTLEEFLKIRAEKTGFFFLQATNSCHTVGYIYIYPHILTDQFSGHIRSRIYIYIYIL